MEFFELIKSRRSYRKFSAQPVARELIEKIIEAGTFAPSACNIQGWQFIVIDKQEIKERIFNMGGAMPIKTAPAIIFVLYDNCTTNIEYVDYVQSGAACIQNMLLATENLGLGACWIAHLPKKKDLQKMFNLPDYLEPIACVILGHKTTSEITPVSRKYDLKKIIGYNSLNTGVPASRPESFYVKRLVRKIYYRLPTGFKKILNNFIDKNFVKKFDN